MRFCMWIEIQNLRPTSNNLITLWCLSVISSMFNCHRSYKRLEPARPRELPAVWYILGNVFTSYELFFTCLYA